MTTKSRTSVRNGLTASFLHGPSFIGALACAAVLFAIAAAAAVLINPAVLPKHLATAPAKSLSLAHAASGEPVQIANANPALGQPVQSAKVVPTFKTPSPYPVLAVEEGASHTPGARSQEQKAQRVLTPADKAARKAARHKLATKLSRLQYARSLVAGRNMRAADTGRVVATAEKLPSDNTAAAQQEASVAVAAAPTLRQPALSEGKTTPIQLDRDAEPDEMASVSEDTQIAGTVPTPATKPAPPQRPSNAQPARQTTSAPVLAYAAPGEPVTGKRGIFSGMGKVFNGTKGRLPGRGSQVAVYDISTATVHMPDGTKLEAHSGIGHRKDKPKYAHVRNLGPTPPNVYDLRMRERRFHGVEAIRMLPRDVKAMKGRDGMLAHTPLLRSSNGSHGCVAFKHYNKFLKAFKAGKVKQMIVVPSMDKLPTYMAKLNRRTGA